jgi:hypothetical protein
MCINSSGIKCAEASKKQTMELKLFLHPFSHYPPLFHRYRNAKNDFVRNMYVAYDQLKNCGESSGENGACNIALVSLKDWKHLRLAFGGYKNVVPALDSREKGVFGK